MPETRTITLGVRMTPEGVTILTSPTGTTIRVGRLAAAGPAVTARVARAILDNRGVTVSLVEMQRLYALRDEAPDPPTPLRRGVRRMDRVTTTVMEPLTQGDGLTYEERDVTKWSFQCLGCGLIWAIKWHAEQCEQRGHVPEWSQRYTRQVFRGEGQAPEIVETWYPRVALGRAAVA